MSQCPDVRFFTSSPFQDEYLDSLQRDLAEATWVRFLVCYFNKDGNSALSPHLARAFRHELSRGLMTLTCACGAEGLQALQRQVSLNQGRLKVFMPLAKEGPAEAKLLHSKMVVVVKPGAAPSAPDRVVLYTGSHNWTGPGLRLKGKSDGQMNVEAGLRVEMDWNPDWLPELGGDRSAGHPVADALRHMHVVSQLESCTDLGHPGAALEIESWLRANCRQDIATPGSATFVVATSVLGGEVNAQSVRQGERQRRFGAQRMPRDGDLIFVQHYNHKGTEPETFDSSSPWALLAWGSSDDLKNAVQPWLLLCRPQAIGRRDVGDPNLQAVQWLLYDAGHNGPEGQVQRGNTSNPPEHFTVPGRAIHARKDLSVSCWRLAPIAPGVHTRDLNNWEPARYVVLAVEAVRKPEGNVDGPHARTWEGTELPFHSSKKRVPRKAWVALDSDGRPSPERAERIKAEQKKLLGLEADWDSGPTGDPDLLRYDIFPCVAPVNDLLFARHDVARRPAIVGGEDERQAVFDIQRDPDRYVDKKVAVPRMEKLVAPGTPHIVEALHLEFDVATRLGLPPLPTRGVRAKKG